MISEAEIDVWKYQLHFDENNRKINLFNVEYDIPIPDTLCKYYALNKFSVEALTENYIYAPHPDNYNDVFDCDHQLIDFDNPQMKSILVDSLSKEFNRDKTEIEIDLSYSFRRVQFDELSCISLTNSPLKNLMWGYYTNHKGFLIEFEHNKMNFPYLGLYPVRYVDKLTSFSYSRYGSLCPFLITTVKTKEWAHEEEWRMIVQPQNQNELFNLENRRIKYSKNSIKSIALGHRFFEYREIKNLDQFTQLLKLDTNDPNKNSELRVKLLNYVAENNIQVNQVERDIKSPFIFKFYGGYIQKKSEDEFLFHDTMSKEAKERNHHVTAWGDSRLRGNDDKR